MKSREYKYLRLKKAGKLIEWKLACLKVRLWKRGKMKLSGVRIEIGTLENYFVPEYKSL